MPVCQKCGHVWSYGETLKRSIVLFNSMRCPNCDREQFTTLQSRRRSSILSGVSILLVMLFNIFFGPTVYTLALLGLVVILLVVTYPRLIKLSNTEEHPF